MAFQHHMTIVIPKKMNMKLNMKTTIVSQGALLDFAHFVEKELWVIMLSFARIAVGDYKWRFCYELYCNEM